MTNDLDLIYYYPSNKGAPSSVGRCIFDSLLNKRDKLPFDDISIFSPSSDELHLRNRFKDVKIYTEKNIKAIPHGIIHIPISPLLFPNSKLLLQIYAKFKKYPLIVNYHGDIRTELTFNFKNNGTLDYSYIPTYIFLPTLLKSPEQLIVHSYLFKDLVEHKYGVSDAKVIPNAVEDFWHSNESNVINKKEGLLEIFYHGRLSAEKGVDILIKGFDKFMKSSDTKKAILYIAGDGPQKKYLIDLISTLKLNEKIILLGNLDRLDIKAYLNMVDAAIYPSLWDNFPLSFIEAFACANCPVYFSKRAGIYDFVVKDGMQMYSFEPTVDNIFNILTDVSMNIPDINIVKNQKAFSTKYNWNTVVDDYIHLYTQFI